MPTPTLVKLCPNPWVFLEDNNNCWLTETILSSLIPSTFQGRVPIQCSSLLLCHDLWHLPIYCTLSWQFLSWKVFSASFTLPLLLLGPHCHSFSSLFCSVCHFWGLVGRSQLQHNVVAIHKTDYLPSIYKVLKPISVNSHSKTGSLIDSWYFENSSEKGPPLWKLRVIGSKFYSIYFFYIVFEYSWFIWDMIKLDCEHCLKIPQMINQTR